MNILILNSTSDLYGSSKILIYVLRALIKKGHRPIVVVSENGPLVDEINALGVSVQIIRLGVLRRKYFNIPGAINRLKAMRKAWHALSKIIETEHVTAIYSNTTAVLIGAIIARRKQLHHTWHVHEIITSPKFFPRFTGYLLKNFSNQIIVVSDAVKNHWERFTGSDKIVRIYNGIDCKPFEVNNGTLKSELGLSSETLLVGMIGRVNSWKGQSYFLSIAKEILKTHPSVRFVMAGDAFPGNENLVDNLQSEIQSLGLSEKVFFLGFRSDTPNFLSSVDIFILPSILPDPFPTVILEAMAASRPIVATNHGGAIEMLGGGEAGVLIPFDEPTIAANLIRPLLDSELLREELSLAGNMRIHRLFSYAAFETAIASIF